MAISSAGISTANGMGASENSIEVLKEIGIDLSNHRSKVITKKLIDESDIILTMTKSHKEILVDKLLSTFVLTLGTVVQSCMQFCLIAGIFKLEFKKSHKFLSLRCKKVCHKWI